MGYLIYVTDRIQPQMVERPDILGGTEWVENPEQPQLPEGSIVLYVPTGYSRFAESEDNRKLLLTVSAEGDDSPDNISGFRDWQANKVRSACNNELKGLYGYYQEFERTTWPQQRREAEMLASGVLTSATPTISGLASARGVTVEEQYQRTLAAIQAYDANCLSHLGVQQQIVDRIYSATTISAVMAESWPTGQALTMALASMQV